MRHNNLTIVSALVLPKSKRILNAPDPFNKEDLQRMLNAAWDKLPEPLPMILETMAMSGMRLGESLAMSIPNLDLQNHQYMVTETTRQGRFGPPKTGARLIDLEEVLVVKLEAHIKQLKKKSLAEGFAVHYLFPGITQRMVQRALRRACLSARLRGPEPP